MHVSEACGVLVQMRLLVSSQIAGLSESLPAAREAAHIRLLASMGAHVRSEVEIE